MARVIFIGPESSGKTVAFQNISRSKNYMKTYETVGISTAPWQIKRSACGSRTVSVTLVDLGGSKKIRGMWQSQFFDTSGAIYFLRDNSNLAYELAELETIIQTTSFPVYLLVNSSDVQVATFMEQAARTLLDKLAAPETLGRRLYCSVCDVSIQYRKNRALKAILTTISTTAYLHYTCNMEEIVTQQKKALSVSLFVDVPVEERKRRLQELREKNTAQGDREENNGSGNDDDYSGSGGTDTRDAEKSQVQDLTTKLFTE